MERGDAKQETRRNKKPVERATVLCNLERSIMWIAWFVDNGDPTPNGTSARLQFCLAVLVFAPVCAKRHTTTDVAPVIHNVLIAPFGTP